MEHYIQTIKNSKILQRTIRNYLICDILCICIAIFFYTFFVMPELRQKTLDNTTTVTMSISEEINTYMSDLASNAILSASSTEMVSLLGENVGGEHHYEKVQQQLTKIAGRMVNLRTISVVDLSDNTQYNALINFCQSDQNYIDSTLAGKHYSQNYSPFYRTDYNPSIYTCCYSFSTEINGTPYLFFFFFKTNSIVNTIATFADTYFDEFALTTYKGTPLYTSENADFTTQYADEEMSAGTDICSKYEHGFIFQKYTNNYYWLFLAYTSTTTIRSSFIYQFMMIILIFLIFSMIVMICNIIVITRIIQPLNKLHTTMQKVSAGSLDESVEFHTHDEIENLGNIFNSMLENIKTNLQNRIDSDRREEKMKFNLLIAQIDSHFICNTMNIINSLARREKYAEIIQANSALTKIIHNSLRVSSYKITDTIEQELDVLNQYFLIQQLRYKSAVELIVDVPSTLMDYEIPKNILQPMVENSLMHGLMNLDTGFIEGTIIVTITKENDRLVISIADDGVGLPPEKVDMLNHMSDYISSVKERGKHIGITNIYQRIKYIYQEKASILFTSTQGLEVTITLPAESPAKEA